MKSAEQWRDAHPCKPFPHLAVLSVEEIRSIQADAMRHAARIVEDMNPNGHLPMTRALRREAVKLEEQK